MRKGVEIIETGEDRLDFLVDGELFTSYHYSAELARPYMYPVIGPGGTKVTRGFPMVQGVKGETTDHPHHRSIWIAHGDVNGTDNWSEHEGHGRTVHRAILEKVDGNDSGHVKIANNWVDNQDGKLLEEERTITISGLPDGSRFIDFEIFFRATERDVKFGDTKEGGIISVRVASSMDGKRTGLITNGAGGRREKETWGKRAPWCDYSGKVDRRKVGIAIFDHPNSFGHPTYWHVRDYGLMTANPFALSDYMNDKSLDGSHVVKSGESLKFVYRLYIHEGDVKKSNVAGQYETWVSSSPK